MVENLKITPEGSYIYCDYTGEFSVDMGMECIDALVEACVKHECYKAILDCSHMSGEMGIFQRFQVIQHAEVTRDIALKTAILARDEQVLPDKFAETVAINRGINLRVFTDIDAAKRWLEE
jgi:hypothetical protein